MKKIIKQIRELIVQYREFIPLESAVNSYPELALAIYRLDIMEEIRFLSEWIQDPNLDVLKSRISERSRNHDNTCLSFFSNPDALCNVLYLKIIEILWPSATMVNWLNIINRDIQIYLQPIVTHENLKASSLHVELLEQSLSALNPGNFNIERLKNFIVFESVLFDVTDIENFDFWLHRQLFHRLTQHYPALAKRLYQHNISLKSLENSLKYSEETSLEILRNFIRDLKAGGVKYSGDRYATLKANVVFTDFLSWLKSLPEIAQQTLMSLTNSNNKSFSAIINDLLKEECVELAASELNDLIIKNASHPMLTLEERLEGVQQTANIRTGAKQLMDTAAEISLILPDKYIEQILTTLSLPNVETWQNLLISFPDIMYSKLLQFAQLDAESPLPDALADLMETDFFYPEQINELMQAIVNNVARFGNLLPIILFAQRANKLHMLLEKIPASERFNLFKLENNNQQNIFHHSEIILSSNLLRSLLQLFNDEEILQLILSQDNNKKCALEIITTNFRAFQILRESLSEDGHFALTRFKDASGATLLHKTATEIVYLAMALNFYPAKKRVEALLEKDFLGRSPLFLLDFDKDPEITFNFLEARLSPVSMSQLFSFRQNEEGNTLLFSTRRVPCLSKFLKYIPQEERANFVMLRNKSGQSVLDFYLKTLPDEATNNVPNLLYTIFMLLPITNWGELLFLSMADGSHFINHLEKYDLYYDEIMERLPLEEYPWVLSEMLKIKQLPKLPAALADTIQNKLCSEKQISDLIKAMVLKNNITGEWMPALMFANRAEILSEFITALPVAKRLMVLQSRDENQSTIFHYLAEKPDALATVSNFLHRQDCIEIFNYRDKYDNNVFSYIVSEALSLQTVIQWFSVDEYKLFTEFRQVTGDTLLHRTAKNEESLKLLLALYPVESRLAALSVKNVAGKTPLCLMDTVRAFEVLKEMLLERELLKAFEMRDSEGNTVLFHLNVNTNNFYEILNLIPYDLLKIICFKNNKNQTFFEQLIVKPQPSPAGIRFETSRENFFPLLLLKILDLLTCNSEKLQLLTLIMSDGHTLMSHLIDYPEYFSRVLQKLPVDTWHELLNINIQISGAPLIKIISENIMVSMDILEAFPEDLRFNWLNEARDEQGNTLLHNSLNDDYITQKILSVLPESTPKFALTLKNHDQETVLHLAVRKRHFLAIPKYLSDEDLLMVFAEKNKWGNPVLHRAINFLPLFWHFLKYFSEPQLTHALMLTNEEGNNLFHMIAHKLNILMDLIKLFSTERLGLILAEKNRQGEAVIHKLNVDDDLFMSLLEPLPNSVTLLNLMDGSGNTLSHKWATNPAALKKILQLIPASRLFEHLQQANYDGQHVLSLAYKTPASMDVIQSLLQTEEWLQVNEQWHQSLCITEELIIKEEVSIDFGSKNIIMIDPEVTGEDLHQKIEAILSTKDAEKLRNFLDSCEPWIRSEVLLRRDYAGDTLLYQAVANHALLKVLLEALTPSERFIAVQSVNRAGQSLLFLASTFQDSFQTIFEALAQRPFYPAEIILQEIAVAEEKPPATPPVKPEPKNRLLNFFSRKNQSRILQEDKSKIPRSDFKR